jgi:DNA-binding Xre family transcriptional regulator
MMAKTMAKKRVSTLKLAPRRLMSSTEFTLVGTFTFDVVVKTCKFIECAPFSEQLSCKL